MQGDDYWCGVRYPTRWLHSFLNLSICFLIEAATKAAPPSATLQIGYTQEEAKNSDKSITAFKKVCRLFPKDQYVSRSHAHLQNKYKITVTLGNAKQD